MRATQYISSRGAEYDEGKEKCLSQKVFFRSLRMKSKSTASSHKTTRCSLRHVGRKSWMIQACGGYYAMGIAPRRRHLCLNNWRRTCDARKSVSRRCRAG